MLNGSFAIANIFNTTRAEIAALNGVGTTINSNTLNLRAADESAIYSGSGAATFGSTAAIGGGLTVNTVNNDVFGYVRGSELNLANELLVNSESRAAIRTVAVAGSASQTVGVSGSFAFSYITNTTEAALFESDLQAKKATVLAKEEAEIAAISGAAAGAGQAAVGGAVAVNLITDTTRGYLEGGRYQITDQLSVQGLNKSMINTLGAAGAGAGTAAISGSAVTSVINNLTEGRIEAVLTADQAYKGFQITAGRLEVLAEDGSQINAVAGQAAGAGTAAIGGGLTTNVITSQTKALINDRVYRAQDNETAQMIAARFGVDYDQLLAVNGLTGQDQLKAGQVLIIPAAKPEWKSKIQGETLVQSVNAATIRTVSFGFAGSGVAAVELIVATSHLDNTTLAGITGVEIANQNQAVRVRAENKGELVTLSGQVTGSTVASLGAATSVNRVANTTEAFVSGGGVATDYRLGNLLVESYSRAAITNDAVGISVSGSADVSVGVAGSIGANFINNTTVSYIDGGAKVVALNNVGVLAENHDVIINTVGSTGIGAAPVGVGFGASSGINEIGGVTKAYIAGSGTEVTALAQNAEQKIEVANGDLTAGATPSNFDLNESVDAKQSLDLSRLVSPNLDRHLAKDQVNGVVVNATATHSVLTVLANVGGGLTVGATGNTGVNLLLGETAAYVQEAKINTAAANDAGASQSVTVSAVDLAHYYGGAGAVAAGIAGVGAGAEANVMTRKTEAYIDKSEAVQAKEAVTVEATAQRKIISIVANSSGGAGAFTGSAALGLIKGETRAYLQASKVETKDLNVTANYKGDFFLATGAAAVGGAGFSNSLSAALDLSLTEAFVSGSQVMAGGKTTVAADTDLILQHWVVSGAAGLAGGIAGNALVDLAATTTKAYILNSDLGAADQRNGSLAVKARDKIELINRAGALGLTLGNVGIGASANVNAVNNTVSAFIDHSTIYTTDQLEVTASTDRKVDAIGASAGIGPAAGLGGNASLILIGSIFNDADSDIKNELNANGQGTLAKINELMTGNRLRTGETDGNIRAGDEGEYGVSGVSRAEITRVNQAGSVDVIGFLNAVGQSGVSALVQDSTLDAGNDVAITAHSADQIRINAGAGGIGAVSAGGTAGVVLMKNNLRAEVTGASTVTAAGNLVIDARSLNSNSGAPAVQVYSFQGSAGAVTLGAAVALADVTNNLTARAGQGTTLNLLNDEGAVKITAVDETNIITQAEGLTAGVATAGLVAAVAKRGGRIEASVAQGGTPGAGTTLTSKGNLILHSNLAGKINAYSQAGTGGAGTLQGTVAEATEESAVIALLGEKLTLEAENASILAEAKPEVKAEAYGYNGALVASVGAVVATATAKPLVTAGVGRNNTIKATDFSITAANWGSALEAKAVAGGGSLGLATNATESTALHQSKVMTLLDASTFMISGKMIDGKMTGGNMNVKAINTMEQKATAGGVTLGGLMAAGGNVAQVRSETETHVKLANGIKGTITGQLAVDAAGTDQLTAEAISGSGGILSGQAAVAGVSKNNRTWVELGGGRREKRRVGR